MGFGGAYALDFGAVMAVAAARGVDAGLLADLLPDVETILIAGLREASDHADD